jgi:dTDP-glucose 4,6-dehydratase
VVTGGAGFIGSCYVRDVLGRRDGTRITVLDKLTYAGNEANLAPVRDDPEMAARLEFVRGDIADAAVVEPLVEAADAVVNFAAESHVDRSIETPGEFIQTDVYGVFVLCEEARRQGVKRFIQVSTDEVYGEVLEGHSTEDWPLNPRSPYAASKAGGDRLAYACWCTYGLPVVVTRCSNNYGPRQYPEKLVPLFITNALEDQPLPVYGTGKNTRDWLHVDDHCDALLALLEHPGVEGETFNIGAQHELDVLTITDTLLSLLGKPKSLIRFVEDRPGHDRRYAVDSSKLTRVTGWSPKIPFEQGIRQTVEWFQANSAWWKAIKSGEFRTYYERMYGQRKVLGAVKA